MRSISSRTRELAERASSGTRVRLLWRQGTTQLWVEVREPGMDQALAIVVPPERALDAFHHAGSLPGSDRARSSVHEQTPQTARMESREQ